MYVTHVYGSQDVHEIYIFICHDVIYRTVIYKKKTIFDPNIQIHSVTANKRRYNNLSKLNCGNGTA